MINDTIKKIDELLAVMLELGIQRDKIIVERDAVPEQHRHVFAEVITSINERIKQLHNERQELLQRFKYEIEQRNKTEYSKDYFRVFSYFLKQWGKINKSTHSLGNNLGDYLVFLQTYKELEENVKRIIHAFYIKHVTVDVETDDKGQVKYKVTKLTHEQIAKLEQLNAGQKNKAVETFKRAFINNIQKQINKSETVRAHDYVLTVVRNKVNGDKILLKDDKHDTILYASHEDMTDLADNTPV